MLWAVESPRLGAESEAERSSPNQSVHRAVAILRTVAAHPEGLTLADLSRAVSLPRPTVVRFVEALEGERLLARAPGGRRVVLGMGLARLAAGYVRGRELLAAARPHVEQLAAKYNETVELAAVADLSREDVYQAVDVLLRIESTKVLHLAPVGPAPLYATSVGKLLLAQWPSRELDAYLARPHVRLVGHTITDAGVLRAQVDAARQAGTAMSVDEVEEGVCGLVSGIFSDQGTLAGVLHLEAPTSRFGPEQRQEALERMAAVARAIESDLGVDLPG